MLLKNYEMPNFSINFVARNVCSFTLFCNWERKRGSLYASGQEKVAKASAAQALDFRVQKNDSFSNFCLVNIVLFSYYLSTSHSGCEFLHSMEREKVFLMPRAARPCTWSKATHHNKKYMKCCELFVYIANKREARENAVKTSKTIKKVIWRIRECLSVFKKVKEILYWIIMVFGGIVELLHHKIN